ncbi:MAG: helix-turn-helix domain-containing protein, partial [Fibrobacter sp.]|nr:helix-turn-helix domain-containing protein [Fibrobacter sp.]
KLFGKKEEINKLLAHGMSQRKIAKHYNVDRNTLARFLGKMK